MSNKQMHANKISSFVFYTKLLDEADNCLIQKQESCILFTD
jgi:hypothetical protein